MRKVLLFALVLLLVAAFLPAQQTTWISPWGTIYAYLPQSMLSFVTSGLFYDEIDIIIRSPGELSNYEGYTFYTMYGNYESWQWTNPLVTQSAIGPVNPFTTNALTQGADFEDILLGAAFPLMDFRAGVIGEFHQTLVNNLTIAGAQSEWTETTTYTDDADADGNAEFTLTNTESYTDNSSGTQAVFGAGVDLGFIGVSLFADLNLTTRRVGGSYVYGYTAGEWTPATPDFITGQTVYYGSDAAGAAKSYPTGSSTEIGAVAELVLPLGIELPIVATALVVTASGGPLAGNIPKVTTINTNDTTNGGGVGSGVTASITYTEGFGGGDYNAESNPYALNAAPLQADDLWANYATNAGFFGALTPATDLENSKNSTFAFQVGGRVDPVMPINELGNLNLVGGLNYGLQTDNDTSATTESFTYTGPDAANNTTTYTYSETVISPQTSTYSQLDVEVGGVVSFHNRSNVFEFEAGMIVNPQFVFGTIKNENAVTTTTYTYNDGGVSGAPTAFGDVVGPAGFEGRKTTVTTLSYADNETDNSRMMNYFIPVATRVNLLEGMFQIINGYTLHFFTQRDFVSTPDTTSTTIETVYSDTAGATEVDSTPTTDITNTVTTGTERDILDAGWAGYMNFMLRWLPLDGLTIDFFGQAVMTALDFDLFSDGLSTDGLNLSRIINNLGMSVTINLK